MSFAFDGTVRALLDRLTTVEGILGVGGPGSATSATVIATGSTTARNLGNRFSDVVNVKDHGAAGDGVTDDTGAFTAAAAALSNGGTIIAPPGVYLANIEIDRDAITIAGLGQGSVNANATSTLGGTLLKPFDASAPVVIFGAGTSFRRGNVIRDLTLAGDATNATGDGIYILGAGDLTIRNVTISSFGRDGVRMESSATQPTTGVYIDGCAIAGNRGAAIRATYGSTYVTNISVSNTHVNGFAGASAYALYLDSVVATIANTYFDMGSSTQGHVYLAKSGSPVPGIRCSGVQFDAPSGGLAIEVPFAATTTPLSRYIQGQYTVGGTASMGGVSHPQAGMIGAATNPWFEWAMVLSALGFPFDEAGASTGTTDVRFSRSGAAGSATLALTGAAMSIPSYLEGTEIADPAAPASNKARLYVRDNGAGKTQLVVVFPTGAVQVIATEP